MLGIYTKILMDFFGQIEWDGIKVPVINATPDRARGELKRWLSEHHGHEFAPSRSAVGMVYPSIAVSRDLFEDEMALRNPAHYVIKDENTGFALIMRKPKPLKCAVEANFYLDTVDQRDYIEYQVHNLFPAGIAHVPANFDSDEWYKAYNSKFVFAKILGKFFLLLRMNRLIDSSAFENSDLSNREVRMTFSGSLTGWLPFQPYLVPMAKYYEITIADNDDNEIITINVDPEELL